MSDDTSDNNDDIIDKILCNFLNDKKDKNIYKLIDYNLDMLNNNLKEEIFWDTITKIDISLDDNIDRDKNTIALYQFLEKFDTLSLIEKIIFHKYYYEFHDKLSKKYNDDFKNKDDLFGFIILIGKEYYFKILSNNFDINYIYNNYKNYHYHDFINKIFKFDYLDDI